MAKFEKEVMSPGAQKIHIYKSSKGLTIPKNFNFKTQLRLESKDKSRRESKNTVDSLNQK